MHFELCMDRRPPNFVPAVTMVAIAMSCTERLEAEPLEPIASGRGRIDCYVHATKQAGLERDKSIRLCIGASSDAPARCFDDAIDRIGLGDEQGVRLCRAADSLAPALCARRLSGIGLEDRQAVVYCAALAWPLVAAPAGGQAECVRLGLDRTRLRESEAVRLCRGSSSTEPIECYEAGDAQTSLDGRRLVTLCAPVIVSAPTAVVPRGVR
jgi:hypothetical protein